jgi:hypothetical protein
MPFGHNMPGMRPTSRSQKRARTPIGGRAARPKWKTDSLYLYVKKIKRENYFFGTIFGCKFQNIMFLKKKNEHGDLPYLRELSPT